MPIYEYNCPKCGAFDAIQGVNDKPLKANPECKEKNCPCKAERVMSAAAFHLKGGGWYKDGYAGAAASKGGESATEPSAASKTAETKSGDSSAKTDKPSTLKSRAGGENKSGGGGNTGCGGGCKCH